MDIWTDEEHDKKSFFARYTFETSEKIIYSNKPGYFGPQEFEFGYLFNSDIIAETIVTSTFTFNLKNMDQKLFDRKYINSEVDRRT